MNLKEVQQAMRTLAMLRKEVQRLETLEDQLLRQEEEIVERKLDVTTELLSMRLAAERLSRLFPEPEPEPDVAGNWRQRFAEWDAKTVPGDGEYPAYPVTGYNGPDGSRAEALRRAQYGYGPKDDAKDGYAATRRLNHVSDQDRFTAGYPDEDAP